jgi:hypothetical protein
MRGGAHFLAIDDLRLRDALDVDHAHSATDVVGGEVEHAVAGHVVSG